MLLPKALKMRAIKDTMALVEYKRRRKFTTSIQPAKAYEDESVMLSGPH